MSMDFPNAELPKILPLHASFAENDIEADLKQLFIDLFMFFMAEQAFDLNVLGAAHLGSFELVRKSINADGLALIQGDREEPSTRYLYRAWKSRNVQGRGLHFLRTYLQLLFPGQCEVYQLVHESYPGRTYPEHLHRLTPGYSMHEWRLGEEGCYLDIDDPWDVGGHYYHADEDMEPTATSMYELFLTSRIQIIFGDGVEPKVMAEMTRILESCIPARFVPSIHMWRDNLLSEPDDFDRWYLGDRHLEPRMLVNLADWFPV